MIIKWLGISRIFTWDLIESLKRILFIFQDYLFEVRYGYELNTVVHNEDLIAKNLESLKHATAYEGVYCRTLGKLISEAKKTGYNFRNFIGVEFSDSLVQIAQLNKIKSGITNITFFNIDATDFFLPNESNLIFMFNPFDNVVLEKFISNNINHFLSNNTVIAYANDVHRLSLIKFGFETIFRNQTRKISLYQIKKS